MPTGDVYETRFEGVGCETQRWNIVQHWVLTDNEAGTLFETSLAIATEAATEFAANALPLMTQQSQFTGVRANRVWPTIGIPAFDNSGAGNGGQSATEPLPADIAAVISKRTNEPGAKARGRMYFPNLVEADNDSGLIPTARAQAIVDGMTQCFIDIQTALVSVAPVSPVVFSRTQVAAGAPIVAWSLRTLQIDQVLRKMTPRGFKGAVYQNPT